jgi:phosphoribosylanthranilate isomerase
MTTTRVKICGLTTAEDRDAAVAAGADALGFISQVPVETPRELAAETAGELVAGVPPLVTSVLVTMPDTVAEAVELQERVGADAVQIHGTLSPAEFERLGDRLDAALIAAVDVSEPEIEAYAAAADAVLVDSTSEGGGGGTGETHDWERTRESAEEIEAPLVLAGGLAPENVAAAIETVDPFAVDTASGVEREGGRKDHESIERFVTAAGRADATATVHGGSA